MEKSLLISMNRGIKKYQSHLEIIILEDGLPLETTFYRVSDFCDNIIYFSLKAITGNQIKLSYSFDTGKLKYAKDDSEAIIEDLFSNRHLRAILFYAWDFKYNHENELDEFNALMHKRCPVPILRTSLFGDYQDKWFKVDSVSIETNTIHMSGILSICGSDYFGQPIIATCVHYYKEQTYKWKYKMAGVCINNKCRESNKSHATTDPSVSNLFRIKAELDNMLYCQNERQDEYNELTRSILKKLKNYEFHVFSPKINGMGQWKMLCFIIKRIVEVNDAEIVFEIWDMESPSSILVYDRTYHGLYRNKRKTYLKKKTEFEFTHNSNGNTDKFFNVIRLIEKCCK